ncbi:putative FAD-dependent oxidoreductase [Actinoplanes missouriensis 431]|uniref:Putative FAD-dependent oxidoreductase n=1 Tax=Actinoplanes missouriensis (strain ATCC 14538 / DSM 43046 / CBS 188.64 / JCM 3121 / NBRC 102363 / NCIMB 12654 / NRRL B-3342 / UNCC 431) TaxID=512565 RepID=I0H1S5_ACTM4|nr:FAD-dependent oxidoreductase [Actinoplanes missouriensis]BAL86962.1 putative FAD-dependent oxidoreductase [Actinoplanes missouriensis 431]
MAFDREIDVLVVGTGAAGLTAAIAAADAGAKVLVVESTGKWGGTTALSGGGLWMPTNPLIRGEDSVEKALTYMEAAIGDAGPASSPERRRAFVETVPEVYALLSRLGVRWVASHDYPDYYPDRPGGMVGRGIEVEPFDTKKLGDWFATFRGRDSMPAPLKTDDVWLLSRAWSTPSGFVRGARFVFRALFGLLSGKRLFGIGSALTASLFTIVRNQGTEVLLNTPLTELIVEDGAVAGAVAGSLRIKASKVILGAGGFARNTAWREKYHGVSGYSSAADGDTGDVIRIAADAGARLELMDDAWWGASVPLPDGHHQFVLSERSMPYSIVVNQLGDRYTNESASYIDFGHAMLEAEKANPSWLILDVRHRRRYLFNAFLTGTKKLREAGIVRSADTIEDLAGLLGMEPARLRATVERFNTFARSGVDADFGRGRTVYDNYYGDPTVKPNPNLGALAKGPFTAVQLVPGDLGTKGGLLTDEYGAVVGVSGLYAAGNTTASVMGRTYPGPGSTIAPAVVFGYRAGRAATADLLTR